MENLNYYGLVLGMLSFFIIGFFHPIVIKAEYHFGKRVWPLFLIIGIIVLVLSIFTRNVMISAILGVFGFSALWSIKEVFEQEKRVEKGWFPKNPKRSNKQ